MWVDGSYLRACSYSSATLQWGKKGPQHCCGARGEQSMHSAVVQRSLAAPHPRQDQAGEGARRGAHRYRLMAASGAGGLLCSCVALRCGLVCGDAHLRLWYTVAGFSPMSPISSKIPSSAADRLPSLPLPLPLPPALRWRCRRTRGPAAPSRVGASVAASEAAVADVSAGGGMEPG